MFGAPFWIGVMVICRRGHGYASMFGAPFWISMSAPNRVRVGAMVRVRVSVLGRPDFTLHFVVAVALTLIPSPTHNS